MLQRVTLPCLPLFRWVSYPTWVCMDVNSPPLRMSHPQSPPTFLSQAASKPAQPRGHCPAAGPAGDSLSLAGEGTGEFVSLSGESTGTWEPCGRGNSSPPRPAPRPPCFSQRLRASGQETQAEFEFSTHIPILDNYFFVSLLGARL